MITKKEKNQICLIICLLTVSALISIALRYLIPVVLISFGYEVITRCHNLVSLFESAIWAFALVYAGLNRRLFNNVVGIVFAFVLAVIQLYYIVINFIGICCGTYSVVDFGIIWSITLSVISFVSVLIFLVSLKQWLPAKITSVLMLLPGFTYNMIYWMFLSNNYDYRIAGILGGITTSLIVILYLMTLVLTVVWMFRPIKGAIA